MKRLAIAFAATLAVALPISAQDGPAALVIRVQGSVSVTHGDGEPAPAAVGEPMFVGDQVIPGAGSRAILITQAGAQQQRQASDHQSVAYVLSHRHVF